MDRTEQILLLGDLHGSNERWEKCDSHLSIQILIQTHQQFNDIDVSQAMGAHHSLDSYQRNLQA
jgi:hypothetical protein